MDTRHLSAFVAAAEAGSLSLAATRLGRQLSGVSRSISQLEGELSVQLLERTGRGVRLTSAGEQYLERSRAALRELEAGRTEVKAVQGKEPTVLRISGPPDLVQRLMPDLSTRLLDEHPGLRLELRGEARRVSAVEESWDAVIRLGAPAASDLLSRKLGFISRALYGAPGTSLEGLLDGRCEFVLVDGIASELAVKVRGRRRMVPMKGRVRVSTFTEAANIAARGRRLVVLPSFSVVPFVESGQLVALAPSVVFTPVEVNLLRLPRHRRSMLLQRLGDLLTETLLDVETRVAVRTGSR